MSSRDRTTHVLDALYAVIESRRDGDPAESHTAGLMRGGPARIAKKVGEEAMEAVIDGALGEREGLIHESADLLYHLLVLWAAVGVKPIDVWTELDARRPRSGIAEKAARRRDR